MSTLTQNDRYLFANQFLRYLKRFSEAEDLLTEAIERDGTDPRLYRQRGHRRMTQRKYHEAREDLLHAADMIKGQPDEHEFFTKENQQDIIKIILGNDSDVRDQHLPVNPETIEQTAGLYKTTLHVSVWYHLGLTEYILGNYKAALDAFDAAEAATVDDTSIAIVDWRYNILNRLGRGDDAAMMLSEVDTDVQLTGNHDYLKRVQLYKGEISPDDLLTPDTDNSLALTTQGYGIASWYLLNGEPDKAREFMLRMMSECDPNAFGYMAAEADLARWDELSSKNPKNGE